MKKGLRIVLSILLLAVFVGSVGMVIRQNINYKEGEASYSEARDVAGLQEPTQSAPQVAASVEPEVRPEPEPEPPAEEEPEENPFLIDANAATLAEIDVAAMKTVNSEVLGWIMIPDTVISYPLVQGEDNQYYLNYTWDQKYNPVGSIFMECMNTPDFSDYNTIIYGHRVGDGSMFNSLHDFTQLEYWSAHPYIYIVNETGVYRYAIFASYEVATTGTTYQLGFPNLEHKQRFIDNALEWSVIETGITPTVEDQFLTLSTCTGIGHATRWVVQGVLEGAVSNGEMETPQD